ncbi:MAG: hypothetical protein LDL31_00970 [Prosthecobacter sp.]|nr:hypothetical protein [Prosthecobacter sp.]
MATVKGKSGAATSAPEGDAERAARKQAAVRELIRRTGKNAARVHARLPEDDLAREAWRLGESWRRSEHEA